MKYLFLLVEQNSCWVLFAWYEFALRNPMPQPSVLYVFVAADEQTPLDYKQGSMLVYVVLDRTSVCRYWKQNSLDRYIGTG